MKISVFGLGSWGVAVTRLLSRGGHEVTAWEFDEAACESLIKTRENAAMLPGVKIPEDVYITNDIGEAAAAKAYVIAVPSNAVRPVSKALSSVINVGANRRPLIVSLAKGIEDGTYKRMSEVIAENIPNANVTALTGPSHAEEVSKDIPTAIVAASNDKAAAHKVQDIFMSESLRVYANTDIIGAELGGALKNVIALAAGICDGLGECAVNGGIGDMKAGDNTKAALMTRGLAEMTRLGAAMGAEAGTFAGLTGLGDLIVTCDSMHSRNRRAGILLGKGVPLNEALKEIKMVVEGVNCARAASGLARRFKVNMPIVEAVNAVLFEKKPPAVAVRELMARDKNIESFGA